MSGSSTGVFVGEELSPKVGSDCAQQYWDLAMEQRLATRPPASWTSLVSISQIWEDM